ncbi:MAG: polyprenol monophosphomannose synthase [Armatimonadetes bacterium]|nr:MAG: polyprenol monophosphomannose synthase [Armatimonadota bacterium]
MSVLVIVPTYNERENIAPIAEAVRSHGYSLLIVDDGSPDGTGQVADQLAESDESIHVLHRSEKQGLGPAYAAGFQRGLDLGAEILCEMDADFSHDPADLPRLVAAVEAGADLAIGSRYVPGGATVGWPWHRRFLSKAGNIYAAMMLGIKVKDSTAGFRAFRDTTIRKIEPSHCEASGYGFQIEMAWNTEKAGLDIVEVPITFRDRMVGESKMDRRIAIEAILLVTRWGFTRVFRRNRS